MVLLMSQFNFHFHHQEYSQCQMSWLTHWGRVTHICVGNLTIIGPDNGLSPGWRQAIIWTNAWILLIGPWGTNFSEILFGIHTFSLTKIHFENVVCEMASILSRPQCVNITTLWGFVHWFTKLDSCKVACSWMPLYMGQIDLHLHAR